MECFVVLRPGQEFGGFEDINEEEEFLFNNLFNVGL
jgi:hypothetical protein